VGDPQRVRQCLINLVGNAIKFTRSGEIVIEVRNVGRSGDGRVLMQFEVHDTGIGISPATLKTLFQPFVQADSSTTRHFGGTGLGLSIVSRLVEMMGGHVGVESEPGKGSTFWFTLPLQPAADTGESPPLDFDRLGRRVLVVDDNETNRRVLAGQLMHAGYEVSLASGGHEALAMLRQATLDTHPFEVVLADYKMRDMDGALLGEHINADPQLSRARIVMLTSMDRHGDIPRFASLGFAAYLTKPIKAGELFECMDRVLSRDAKDWHMQSQPIVTRGTLSSSQQPRFGGHVLLVEDNAVNQKVAVRFLERMGCTVRVADNGAEGVKAYNEAVYAIVLMDLQMPVMDGLTATGRIRELETGARRTPIVALTANAMSGQLDRCLQAGMDGFLTKPLEISRLQETLERFGLGRPTPVSVSPSELGPAAVDLQRLREITEGDAEFALELATTFIDSGRQVMQEVHTAMAIFDRALLCRAAHKLKGASANIHAEPLAQLAYTLENQGANLDQPRLKELVERLDHEFERAAAFLNAQTPRPEAKAG
jgi:CheY-like chemotaxis protein